jgi:TBC1 domain family member 8/9
MILVDNSAGRIDSQSLAAINPYEQILEDGSSHGYLPEQEKLHFDDIVNIQFTSGTTSMPKAACLTHRNILNNGKSIGDRMLLTPEDIVCCPPPLFQYVS